jgi:hypothetical protein
VDQSDDIRGGMGIDGLTALAKFVEEGGTLITEGSTATIFPDYGLTPGVTVEHPADLFVRGSILRGKFSDMKSPIAYGYEGTDLPVYFNQDPVLNTGGGGGGFGGGGGRGGAGGAINGGEGQNVTPNAVPVHISPWNTDEGAAAADASASGAPVGRGGRGGGRGGRGGAAGAADTGGGAGAGGGQGGGGGRGAGAAGPTPRVVMRFPTSAADMLLSGTLANGEGLANRAAIIDSPVGKGHVVMFALRPFWRWQTQGTYTLGFNAILNWNALDAGREAPQGGRGGRGGGDQQN